MADAADGMPVGEGNGLATGLGAGRAYATKGMAMRAATMDPVFMVARKESRRKMLLELVDDDGNGSREGMESWSCGG